jgi:hypothetical protein
MIFRNIVLFFILSSSILLANSIFTTEGINNVNVKVLGKSKFISKEFKQKLQQKIVQKLTKVGITTKSEEFSTLAVKIEIVDLKKHKL